MTLGVYVHVPFCLQKCLYCDFISYPRRDSDVALYLQSLDREVRVLTGSPGMEGCEVQSVYIGGGTPTCLTTDELSSLLELLLNGFEIASGAEITVEANPGTVDRTKMAVLKGYGVNRLSIGFQSARDGLLSILGRSHNCQEALKSFYQAREAGFENISVDMIFGIPGQAAEEWLEDLAVVASLGPDHFSIYGLQYEEGTRLAAMAAAGLILPCSEDEEAVMYGDAIELLAARGYQHYEISNFALDGRQCRHNLRYWLNGDYLGLGPAAHSCTKGRRTENFPGLADYAAELACGRLPVKEWEITDTGTAMAETVFLGLRVISGLDERDFARRFGVSVHDVFGERIKKLESVGLLSSGQGRIRLTRRGIFLANRVFREFV